MNKYLFLSCLTILSCSNLLAQANFTADTTAGCSPLVINFQDLTQGAVSWEWDFGNGNSSTLQNPGTTYIAAQSFTVSLTVGFANGSTQTVTKNNFINISEQPQALFEATPATVCIGDAIQLNDLSISGSANISEWLWDFGDGSISTLENPTYIHPLPACYTITLAIKDANSCSDVLVLPNYICVNEFPDASFSANNTLGCNPPFPVQFTSTGANTNTLNHFWDFGNGETSTLANPSYVYRNEGLFTVTHVVSDAAGCSDTLRLTNLINVGQNTVNIQVSDSSSCLGEAITFSCGATAGSTVLWDFGDGTTSTICNVSHSYTAAGTYTATATITDPDGCSFVGTKEILIGEAPNASFDTDRTLLCEAPFTVNFTNTSINIGSVSYQWTLSDGGSYTSENVIHTFPNNPPEFQPYLYNISLTVTNEAGCSATETKVNHIVNGHTVAAINASPRSGCAPLSVAFEDSSYSTSVVNSWQWDFGDGNTSTEQNPIHTYLDTGFYSIRLIIGTTGGCSDTVEYQDYIDMGEPVSGDFDAVPTIACAQQPVQFTLLNTNVDSVRWLFGDGGESIELDPEHAYTDVGIFDVSLITYNRGCADTLTKFQYLDIQPPIARFTMSSSIGCELPFRVFFTDQSIGADSWEWDFGDGTSSTEQNPQHIYTSAGTFIVTLLVRNAATGCEYAIDNTINVVPLDVGFIPSDSSGCFPFEVSFTDSSVNAISWEWDFGDGTTSTDPNPVHIYQRPGSYHLQLKVENVLGCRDSIIRYNYITAWGPDISFEVVDPSDCAPFSIQFFNNTTSLAPVLSWEWDFGDGTSSNEQAPLHEYTIAGSYDISLSATDSLGCAATQTIADYILITDPIADFTVRDTLNCPGNQVVFTNQSEGLGLSYVWEFGDGGTSTEENPVYAYNNVGTYAVRLIVNDINNCPADTVKVNYIVVAEPMVDFVADTTTADCPALLVNFTPSVFSVHNFVTWQWNFGDGTISFQEAPEHVYGLAGTYTVSLVAITDAGCRDTVTYTDMINVDGPIGDFTFDPTIGCPGLNVNFVANSPNTTTFQWDFGTGQLGSGQTVTTVYHNPGSYRPILILDDGVGCEVVIPSADSIIILPQPIANFGADLNLLCEADTVLFTDSTTGDYPITNWLWDFGDGNTSLMQNPSYIYSTVGTFDVSLIVTHDLGCADTLLIPDFIRLVPPPQASIGLSDTIGCLPLEVEVFDQSLIGDAPIRDRWWYFGVANDTSVLANDRYVYDNVGVYTLTLIVTDTLGCVDSVQRNVEALAPQQIDFVASDTAACVPQLIDFTDLTLNATAWQWAFGDGASATDQNPQYEYQQAGTYTVSLIVTDINGCTDTLNRVDYISLNQPQADFSLSDSVVCPDEVLTLTDQSTSVIPLVAWEWEMGDGSTLNGNPANYSYSAPGIYDLSLKVTDSLACVDSIVMRAALEVLMNQQPLPPDMYYVSVLNDREVEVAFQKYPNSLNDFGSYHIFREDGAGVFTQFASSTNLNDTTITDIGLNTLLDVYCYRIQVSNGCANPSDIDLSETHCTVNLSQMPQLDAIELNWTNYVGWPQVDAYNIYRVDDYATNNPNLIASVPGNVNSYLDTDMFCYQAYSYRVEAVNANDGYSSWSDTTYSAPIHFGPQSSLNIIVATVVDNRFISVSWNELAAGEDWVEILLERDSGFGFEEIARRAAGNPIRSYDDMDVNVQERSYAYRIFGLDICGDQTLLGTTGRTIFLETNNDSSAIQLNWNTYEDWPSGVALYRIEFFMESLNRYITITNLGDSLTNFVDDQTEVEQAQYCYRIIAYEQNGNLQRSVSNEVCIRMNPRLHTPNAFTPNNDGINDFFTIKGLFVNDYSISIYDRWGSTVFESQSLDEAWDGKLNGREVQEGVYVYRAWGRGLEGQLIQKMGTVTLVR